MPQFDPRVTPARLSPTLVGVAAVALSALVGAGVAGLVRNGHAKSAASASASAVTPSAAKLRALEHQAFAEAGARPGLDQPTSMPISIKSGETFESAVQRTGVGAEEARLVVKTLAGAFDTVNIRAGLAFQAVVAKPRGRGGPAQLVGLSMKTGPASAITLSRTFDGALRLRELEEQVRDDTTVAQGEMKGSLYEAALKAGASPNLTDQVIKLFGHKLDFSRDIQPGDGFRMVYDRKVTESGRTVENGDLLYAEIGAKGHVTRFYRFVHDGDVDYFDEDGKNTKGFLLKTPIDGAHITSLFGQRKHPILGYTRMHPGIDFGAPKGTPVYAAGDGVVEQAGWAGGYGNFVKIGHNSGWETGYGHLSKIAVKRGQRVRQGQVVAYVGSTGLSTGPHLHYEISFKGAKLNPKGANVPQGGSELAGSQLAAFKMQKGKVDGLLAHAAERADAPQFASLDLKGKVSTR
jgi:murein DD-endopeptidase MepM/ murein hydrolase activator NlpD